MALTNEFLASCATAKVVTTLDGPALLLGGNVVQFKGSDSTWADAIAEALRMVPQKPTEPVEQPAPTEPPLDSGELVNHLDSMMREAMSDIAAKR